MDFKTIPVIIISASLLYTEGAFRKTSAGCSSILSTNNWNRTCAVSYTTTQGSSVYLDCEATNEPSRKASWRMMNQNNYSCLAPALGKLKNTVLHKNFTLELRNVSGEDDGIYVCIYLGDPVASYCLFVIDYLPAIPTMSVTVNGEASSGTMSAILGQKYVLQCAVFDADPPVNLTWSYNFQVYNKDESNSSVNVVGNASNVCTSSLGLVPIRAGSSNVTCFSNGRYQEQGIMSTLEIEIYAIPKLFLTVNNTMSNGTLLAVVHRKYDLKCIAQGAYPTVNLTWNLENEDFFVEEYNHSSYIRKDQTSDSVISFRYTSSQTGSSNITCSSNGMYFSQNLSVTLHVQVYAIPSLFIDVHGKTSSLPMRFQLKKQYTLSCVASDADPAVNLTWFYNHLLYNVEENSPSFNMSNSETYSTMEFTPIKTGFSNIVCHSTGIYQEQNVNYTLHVEAYAQPVFTNWIIWFGLAIFVLSTITIVLIARYKARKYNTPKENNIYYRGILLSPKSSTLESLTKRGSGSIQQKDSDFEVDTIDKITREDVSVMTLIPSKSFLKYFKGSYSRSGKRGYVLVKTVKEYAYVKDIYTFVKYSRLMESLPKHENVVALLGISDEEMPIYSYHEYVECLTLRNYMLRNYQSSGLSASSTFTRNSCDGRENNITIELYEFAENVASGMSFLLSQNFKHPALSLRKVLLTNSGQCKLYDIWPEGMSSDRIRYLLQRKDPPLAWMAPECVFLGQYHLNTDVWSYGVFMWELFSFGETPFKNMSTFEIENEVRNSRNLPMPPNCPGAVFSLMLSSWNKDAEKRPHFDNILKQLSCLLQSIQHENYNQREVDVIQERNSQYHKYFTLEGHSTD